MIEKVTGSGSQNIPPSGATGATGAQMPSGATGSVPNQFKMTMNNGNGTSSNTGMGLSDMMNKVLYGDSAYKLAQEVLQNVIMNNPINAGNPKVIPENGDVVVGSGNGTVGVNSPYQIFYRNGNVYLKAIMDSLGDGTSLAGTITNLSKAGFENGVGPLSDSDIQKPVVVPGQGQTQGGALWNIEMKLNDPNGRPVITIITDPNDPGKIQMVPTDFVKTLQQKYPNAVIQQVGANNPQDVQNAIRNQQNALGNGQQATVGVVIVATHGGTDAKGNNASLVVGPYNDKGAGTPVSGTDIINSAKNNFPQMIIEANCFGNGTAQAK